MKSGDDNLITNPPPPPKQHQFTSSSDISIVNLFHVTSFFKNSLKTSENMRSSHVFRGYRKGVVLKNGLIWTKIFGAGTRTHLDPTFIAKIEI